jgi:hypothetical protein
MTVASDDDHDGDHHDDDDKPKPPPDDDDPQNTTVTVQEKTRQRWRGPLRRYGQAQQRRPADRPNRQAAFSTGPAEAVEYHYHRVPTYQHQYAQDMATGMENNPT